MLVYVWRDDQLYHFLVKVDKDSATHETERVIEVPDELVARHDKALNEFEEVQKLVRDFLGDRRA